MENNIVEFQETNLKINNLLDRATIFLEKGYLEDKEKYEILELPDEIEKLKYSESFRVIQIEKIVYEKDENILDRLVNVFTTLHNKNHSIFLILKSDGKICNLYLGIKDIQGKITEAISTLKAALHGNFRGIAFDDKIDDKKTDELMKGILNDNIKEISTSIGIPSLKSEDKDKFLQGIEKVIEGMDGREFSAVFIADPVNYSSIKNIKNGYEELYDRLFPFVTRTFSLNKSEAKTVTEGITDSFSTNFNKSLGKTDGTNISYTNGENTSKKPNIISKTIVSIFGGEGGSGKSSSETSGKNSSESYTESTGETKTESTNYSDSMTDTIGKTLQLEQKNKKVENIIKKIENYLERIEHAEGKGFWNIGTYFIGENQNSVIAANLYNGIVRGENSSIEKNGVYTLRKIENGTKKEVKDFDLLKEYIYNFSNPLLKLNDEEIITSMGSYVTTDELTVNINFPKKSISGVSVIEMEPFGRNLSKEISEEGIKIGKLYHLGKEFSNEIKLDVKSLSSHTFITGSTGAGKSNAIYKMLEQLIEKEIKFMVIEPAKGEYKNIFGGREDVSVYGTNINYTELLKINPFSFNENIHVLEHIDRLVEIFNACWPMYAAMPAILKEAIEKSYEIVGWDLSSSINIRKKYPTLKDLKISLENIISSSSYSEEMKGNYIGALVTRVNSLSNGLIGNIFSDNEISEQNLFDENVIIDISRIPSMETKALLMGIMFMKLHEYRMSENNGNENQELKHVTILEEAHNLLRKTSFSQSQEGANLQGKSVEMMVNAIAEMRTYGEGFIIADQAPGLLDEAVIRNTNTKICLKLPNKEDREIVGKSMNLSDEQIAELSRLETGVGAIIQNNWIETLLVKFDYMDNKRKYEYSNKEPELLKQGIMFLLNDLKENKMPSMEIIEFFLKNNIKYETIEKSNIDKYIVKLLNGEKLLEIVNITETNTVEEWCENLRQLIANKLNIEFKEILNIQIIDSILKEEMRESKSYEKVYSKWKEGVGVIL